MITQSTLCRLAFILPAVCMGCTAYAQTEYPNKPIRWEAHRKNLPRPLPPTS